MNWLKRKVIQWVREDWENERKKNNEVVLISAEGQSKPEEDPILTFRVYGANNGTILEFRRWDKKQDRSFSSTYIIDQDQDIAEYVQKCLPMEMLK